VVRFNTINPATEEFIAEYCFITKKNIDESLKKSDAAQKSWMKLPVKQRVQRLNSLSNLLLKNQERLAILLTTEIGKPIQQSRAEIEKCRLLCDYYCEHAESFLKAEHIKTADHLSQRTFAPLGLILGIAPWNFPFWQVFRFAIPNLMAGNGIVLKHAENATGCALAMADLFQEAGFSPQLFITLIVAVEDIEFVISHQTIRGITLTGSARAGAAVAMESGRALKKVVLELGGSDPYLILDDADIHKAAHACVTSRLNNAGQVCVAAKRILVHKKIQRDFIDCVLEFASQYLCGDPAKEETILGPMARNDLRHILYKQVSATIENGAECLLGGVIPEGPGFFFPATVLTKVNKDALAFKEELFGPVIGITSVNSTEEALMLANQTPFGLGAAIFSKNIKKAQQLAEDLDVGIVAINDFVASNPALPFGGTKQSGFGRELSLEGMREFVNIKTIMIKD